MVRHPRPSLTADRHRRPLSLTGGSTSLTVVDGCATSLAAVQLEAATYKVQRYEVQMAAEGSVPGVDPEGSRRPRCTLSLVDLDIDS
nr:hypothetical protein [Tanacetum cinerariifolium]